jgi:glucose-6-phosphate 1-dehydrogenase
MTHTLFILFGATGDLARRYIFPSLARIAGEHIDVIATGRREYSDSEFQDFLMETGSEFLPPETSEFVANIRYKKIDLSLSADYHLLRDYLTPQIISDTQIIVYLSIGSEFFSDFISWWAQIAPMLPHVRIVLEKPFGVDLASARALQTQLMGVFAEEDIYRIDHYVAKWGIQNIMTFRFANTLFEPLWDNHSIDHIQITANETLSVGDRGRYYETAGALRDMVQNHLFQTLAILLMRRPASMSSADIRIAKTELLGSLSIKDPHTDVVFGQYIGYRDERDVASDSRMETFTALAVESSLPQYRDIPIYIRTGKCLDEKKTSIVIELRKSTDATTWANRIVIEIQPRANIEIHFNTRAPEGSSGTVSTISSTADLIESKWAYQRLIEDVIAWDHTFFTSWEMLEATWELIDSLIHCKDDCPIITPYARGSHGPDTQDYLLAKSWRQWYTPRQI